MREDASLEAMGQYFKLEGIISLRLLDQFLADPDMPFAWNPVTAGDLRSMRQEVIGTGFAASTDVVDRISNRLVDTIVTYNLIEDLSQVDPDGELIHPSLDADSQRAFIEWSRAARGDASMNEDVGADLFTVASALMESDSFRKIDLIDKVFDIVQTQEGFDGIFLEAAADEFRQDARGLDELDRGQSSDLDDVLDSARTIAGPSR